MLYEVTASYVTIDNKGNDKVVKVKFMVNNCETFASAECTGYEYLDGQTDLDIVSIKRSNVKDIINHRTTADERIFLAEVVDTQTNDEGEEVELVYKVLLYAKDTNDALSKVNEYLKQGFNMTVDSIKKTKFEEIL